MSISVARFDVQALSDAHTYLFEERQRLLDLQAENDELKLQEMDDRKRIQHLLALTEPVEQEITYGRDAKTDTFKLLPTRSSSTHRNTYAPPARLLFAMCTHTCKHIIHQILANGKIYTAIAEALQA